MNTLRQFIYIPGPNRKLNAGARGRVTGVSVLPERLDIMELTIFLAGYDSNPVLALLSLPLLESLPFVLTNNPNFD